MVWVFTFETDAQREKFEYLYNSYKGLMMHKARGILRDSMLAEDAVSEAFMRIFKNLHKIDDPDSNKSIAFVMIVVKNVALSMLKKEKSRKYEPLEEYMPDDFQLENHSLGEISAQEIVAVIDSLDESMKNVFLLKYNYDLSHREISRLLNISENNVTVRLHRAKKKIAEMLKKEGYLDE